MHASYIFCIPKIILDKVVPTINIAYFGLKHILFDHSLLHRYNIKEVGSDSKP